MTDIKDARHADAVLAALGEQIGAAGERYELVVVGGPDLRALEPSEKELLEAARWSRGHDPSPGYREILVRALEHLGVNDADLGA